mgnify:CR=1 FL=1
MGLIIAAPQGIALLNANVGATVLDYEETSVSKHYEYQSVVLNFSPRVTL